MPRYNSHIVASYTFTLHPTALRIRSTSYRPHGDENDATDGAATCYIHERGVLGCWAEVASSRQQPAEQLSSTFHHKLQSLDSPAFTLCSAKDRFLISNSEMGQSIDRSPLPVANTTQDMDRRLVLAATDVSEGKAIVTPSVESVKVSNFSGFDKIYELLTQETLEERAQRGCPACILRYNALTAYYVLEDMQPSEKLNVIIFSLYENSFWQMEAGLKDLEFFLCREKLSILRTLPY